jgi:leucyl/phenylalanyl-tRNA--protein transferase
MALAPREMEMVNQNIKRVCFFGESMFARVSDASKCAFAHFASIMFEKGLPWIDCQVHTDHLARFGAKEIPRVEYLLMLRDALKTY